MKKRLVVLCIVVVFIIFIFTILSCNRPELNIDKAIKMLENNGYIIIIDESDELDENIIRKVKAIDDEDYLIFIEYKDAKIARKNYKELKSKHKEKIKRLKESMAKQKLKYEKYGNHIPVEKYLEYINSKESIENLRKEINYQRSQIKFGVKGKLVWTGNKDAIHDSKRK